MREQKQYMNKMLRRSVSALVAAFLFAGTFVAVVQAQSGGQGNGFRISPVRSELVVERGTSQTLTITVENPTGATLIAQGVVNNFVASDKEDGEPRLILDDNAQQPRNNFKKLVSSIPNTTLAPNQKKDIPVTISVPENADAGGYYGAIRFVPNTSESDGNVALTASVGTIVLVRVPGNLTEKLILEQIGASQDGKTKGFITGGDVAVATRLKNVGNIHVQPFGKVQVKDMFGKLVQEYEINSTDPRANILPESTRRFEDKITKPKRGWLGRYTITANIGYSQGSGDLITTSTTFWYLPTWFIILVIVLILAISGGIWWFINGRRGGGGRRRGRGHSPAVRRF